ncbi:ribonuclease H-like domain-containing protein [Tanacetum coccineum]
MSVHNSKHNTPNNIDHDDDIHDSVTRISKLDISDPLHLHPNDTTALTVVSIKLKSKDDEVLGKQWDRVNAIVLGFNKHNQLLKLMQFLMGLDDSYMQIRSSILSRETLSDVRSVYATIYSEDSHRVAVGSIVGSSQRNQASIFVSKVPYSQNFQRSNQNFNVGPSRPNNVDNNRQSEGSKLVYENCGFNGHIIDRCFKINGYLADFGKKKSGQNFKKQNVSNNNYVGKSSSSGFTDEQMDTLLSLIKDIKFGKNMQVNMAGANHHKTYTDKELDNVIDISHLKIKLGHPNRTEAYISKIGNLRLSNGLTLLGHPADPVLNVLKDSLNFDIKDNTICCEISQRAKQTSEPFLLSNHKSKSLGDLVHLDLWGPYKVTSSERFRYFLIVVDDYTRAVWVYLIKSKDEIPKDDERVANDLNKGKSDSSSSSESGSNINAADFSVDSGNDADSSNDFVATQNEEVATLEENAFSGGNLDQNPSSSQGVQKVRRSFRQSVFPKNYNDFVVESKVKYGLDKYVGYSKLGWCLFFQKCLLTAS